MCPTEFNVEFRCCTSTLARTFFLRRSLIHMVGVVSCTLHQVMKFVWKDQELVIYGEEIHSNGYAPIVDEVFQGCDFYTVELVNATGDDFPPKPPMPSVYKMIATLILQNCL